MILRDCLGILFFEITKYDLRALVVLYGDDGFKDPFSLLYLDIIGYLILGGIVALIVYFVNRRSKRKKLEFR